MMGLFDDVECRMPLPDGCKHKHFQTKDFPDPYMDKYIITEEGRLVERPWIKGKRTEATVDLDFHGMLNFYHYDTDTKEVFRYQAKFTDGQLVEIKIIEDYFRPLTAGLKGENKGDYILRCPPRVGISNFGKVVLWSEVRTISASWSPA